MSRNKNPVRNDSYVPWNKTDHTYAGAKDVVAKEYEEYLRVRRPNSERDKLTGIALSGGGIRSASFCLGVLQALAFQGWLSRMDYLSTVSGGGYIGSALTWLLHKKVWRIRTGVLPEERKNGQKDESEREVSYGVDGENFPYATNPVAAHIKRKGKVSSSPSAGGQLPEGRDRGAMLRFLRQHASYLTPGNGVNRWSLAAIVLRASIFTLSLYTVLVAFGFLLLGSVGSWLGTKAALVPLPNVLWEGGGFSKWFTEWFTWWAGPPTSLNIALLIGITFFALFLACVVIYGPITWMMITKKAMYQWRLYADRFFGFVLSFAFIVTVVGVVPLAERAITTTVTKATQTTRDFVVEGTRTPAGELAIRGTIRQEKAAPEGSETKGAATVAGLISALLGIASGIATFIRTSRPVVKRIVPTSVLVVIAAGALLFGVLLLAYSLSAWINGLDLKWTTAFALAIGSLVLGRLVNLNYISIHRFYRDRLTESFLPDLEGALAIYPVRSDLAKLADATPLHHMCGGSKSEEEGGKARDCGPYHIINTNVVLVSSSIPKFRGRGGDNFILSPKFCGSNATGWIKTDKWSENAPITLATAMATSGAAVNPNTGGAGGVMRQPLVSAMMGLLNIRLGYWILNPRPPAECRARQDVQPLWKRACYFIERIGSTYYPNAISPGVSDLAFRMNLDENCKLLQLSDGGHFDNLGLYELLRRRLRLIIVCDGAADPGFHFEDLANALEKARADFGIRVKINGPGLEELVPRAAEYSVEPPSEQPWPGAPRKTGYTEKDPNPMTYANRGYLEALIHYPSKIQGQEPERGRLLYLTTTFFRGLSADLYGYRRVHREFPDEPTSDQFFDEKQFEAYRELGYQTAFAMTEDDAINSLDEVVDTVFSQ